MKSPIFLPSRLLLFILVLCCCVHFSLLHSSFNPYHVLGLQKSASIAEIKHAYKNLARKFHPDKNKESSSHDKFIEVNKAYDVLLDPERRRHFDKTGIAEESPNFHPKPDYSNFNRFDFDTFNTYFTRNNGQKIKYTFNTGNYFRKHSITNRAFENTISPQSYNRPFILVFYADLCIPCIQIEHLLQKVMTELESVGVGFATVHTQHESALARKVGLRSLPHIVSLVEGEIRQFRQDEVSFTLLVDFIRKSLPSGLVSDVNDANYVDFLSGWRDNKVRVLFVNEDQSVKLQYLLVAFYFNQRIAFGHVVADESSKELRARYHIDPKMNSMLIFNEDISRSIATLSVSELKTQLMKDVLDLNKFLLLPRITSQIMFDQLCPISTLASRIKLCVMLVSSDNTENEPKFEAMRNYIRENNYPKDRFRFMYIHREKQTDFVRALSEGFKKGNINRGAHVVVFWRRESDHVFYEWLENEWDLVDSTYMNETRKKLSSLLERLSQNAAQFPNSAKISSLIDETAKSLISRLVKRVLLVSDNIGGTIASSDFTPILSAGISFAFILLIGYSMVYFMRLEEENVREKSRNLGPGYPRNKREPLLNIHELRGETYNGLVRLLKPGCRTIVLLCDASSKQKLLAQFRKVVSPYRKNKTLLFAFFLVEKNLDWYKKVLLQTLGEDRDLNINPKNCIGTVISINGFRKHFCVYHAKHPEIRHNRRNLENGDFLGLHDDSDISSDQESDVESGMLVDRRKRNRPSTGDAFFNDIHEDIIFEENLLDGLPHWLEKLFEGSTTRYHINYWPDHMK